MAALAARTDHGRSLVCAVGRALPAMAVRRRTVASLLNFIIMTPDIPVFRISMGSGLGKSAARRRTNYRRRGEAWTNDGPSVSGPAYPNFSGKTVATRIPIQGVDNPASGQGVSHGRAPGLVAECARRVRAAQT
jgi:hypothetical protein